MFRLVDWVVIFANWLLFVVAVMTNIYGATHDEPRRRPYWAAIAALSTVYSVGYFWLIIEQDVLTWSSLFRGVSIPVLAIMWVVPPVYLVREHRKDKHQLEQMRDRIEDET